jgi:hypothetical protein
VKKIIEYATGIPADQQRLVCHGIDLEDHQTVSYYNIKDDTTVHLIRILHGGINNSLLPPVSKFQKSHSTSNLNTPLNESSNAFMNNFYDLIAFIIHALQCINY